MSTRLKGDTLILAFAIFVFSSRAEPAIAPDLVVLNATVITIDEKQPSASAFAVHQGKFIAVGETSEILKYAEKAKSVLDLEGKTVVPGFNDAHLHPRELYDEAHPRGTIALGPQAVSSMDELVARLAWKAERLPEGLWISGSRYEDTKLGRHPTRHDLDKASTKHPISIRHSSGHIAVYNTYALSLAGIDASTKDPDGGSFDRDPDGHPSGIARERASGLVSRAGPEMPEPGLEERIEAMNRCLNEYINKGVTSIGDAGASPEKLGLFQEIKRRGNPIRISLMIRDRYLDELEAMNIQRGFGDDGLRISAVKVFHGNSLSGRTCWLEEPYETINQDTGKQDYYGIPPARSQEELINLIARIHDAGLQAAVHSNGDREIPMVLDAFEKAMAKNPRPDPRHRIEHCSVVNETIIQRLKALGVVVAPHSYIYEHGDKMIAYGNWRWGRMHANRSFIENGIPVAQNSDSPVSPCDPLLRFQSMVTRASAEGKVFGRGQKVEVETAIKTWTIGGAYATFEEDVKGSIESGKLADFVILDQDPRSVQPLKIKDVPIEGVYINGELRYSN